jgi:inositol transport system ATP-binding protein
MGAGRTELAEAIFGIHKLTQGDIYIHGEKCNIKSEADAIKNGMALVSEDRKLLGLNLVASVRENISLVHLIKFTLCKQLLRLRKEKIVVKKYIDSHLIKTSSDATIVGTLSGGNQQKVVLAKWVLGDPEIVILDEPTRGIDVGSKAEIHKIMGRFAQQGKAIIMISSELPEIIGMSDRVIVLHEGRLTGELKRDELTQERIMHYAIGNV